MDIALVSGREREAPLTVETLAPCSWNWPYVTRLFQTIPLFQFEQFSCESSAQLQPLLNNPVSPTTLSPTTHSHLFPINAGRASGSGGIHLPAAANNRQMFLCTAGCNQIRPRWKKIMFSSSLRNTNMRLVMGQGCSLLCTGPSLAESTSGDVMI